MKAQILTLFEGTSTEVICRNIAYVTDTFGGRGFIEHIKHPLDEYCAVITDKRLSKQEAEIVYKALYTAREYERERDFMEGEKIERLDIILEDLNRAIINNKIHKLPKLTEWLKELTLEYA